RRPVGGHDPHLHRNAKTFQPFNGGRKHRKITVAAHDYRYFLAHNRSHPFQKNKHTAKVYTEMEKSARFPALCVKKRKGRQSLSFPADTFYSTGRRGDSSSGAGSSPLNPGSGVMGSCSGVGASG